MADPNPGGSRKPGSDEAGPSYQYLDENEFEHAFRFSLDDDPPHLMDTESTAPPPPSPSRQPSSSGPVTNPSRGGGNLGVVIRETINVDSDDDDDDDDDDNAGRGGASTSVDITSATATTTTPAPAARIATPRTRQRTSQRWDDGQEIVIGLAAVRGESSRSGTSRSRVPRINPTRTGTSRERAGPSGERPGPSRERAGPSGDRVGPSRERAGPSREHAVDIAGDRAATMTPNVFKRKRSELENLLIPNYFPDEKLLPTWPMPPIRHHCSGCSVLREVTHTNGL